MRASPFPDQVEIVIEKVDLLILPCLQTAYNQRTTVCTRFRKKMCAGFVSDIFLRNSPASSCIIAYATDRMEGAIG
jgi:hypothetical protein